MDYKFIRYGVLQLMSQVLRNRRVLLIAMVLYFNTDVYANLMLHACETRTAVFPWDVPPMKEDLGLTVIYRYKLKVRNIIRKLPGIPDVTYSDDRAELRNNNTTLALNHINVNDEGFFTISTTLPRISFEDIEMVIHLEPDCPPEDAITNFKVLTLESGTTNLITSLDGSSPVESLLVNSPIILEFIVRIPHADPGVRCFVQHAHGNYSYTGSTTDNTICSWTVSVLEDGVSNVTIELDYIADMRGVKVIQITPTKHDNKIATNKQIPATSQETVTLTTDSLHENEPVDNRQLAKGMVIALVVTSSTITLIVGVAGTIVTWYLCKRIGSRGRKQQDIADGEEMIPLN